MKWHVLVYVQTKFVPRISPEKENYIQLLDLTWPKQNSRIKNHNPHAITFLMIHPLLTLKPQTNTRKYQLKHSFIITFIVSVLRILNMTYNVFGKRYKPIHFSYIAFLHDTKTFLKRKLKSKWFVSCFTAFFALQQGSLLTMLLVYNLF